MSAYHGNTFVRLGDYSTTPLYNIKAVVQATNISPSTLRAWERRYKMCIPQRSDSGYRLYSERDIAVIRWLKTQVDAGMSISQAVSWLDRIAADSQGIDHAALPATSGSVSPEPASAPVVQRALVRDFSSLHTELLHALLQYDEHTAEGVLSEAFAMYPVELVGEQLIQPVLVEIGERWHRGELSVTAEHFASNYMRSRLAALARAVANGTGAPLIWVGCAPGELHEIGAQLLIVYLRRAGYRVHFFGQSLLTEDFAQEVKKYQPAMVLFSASTVASAQELGKLTTVLVQLTAPRPLIGYGGQAFNKHPELRSAIAGFYLGASAHEAVETIDELLAGVPKKTKAA
jgi:methanogenic corrinoid protein MtbC1